MYELARSRDSEQTPARIATSRCTAMLVFTTDSEVLFVKTNYMKKGPRVNC